MSETLPALAPSTAVSRPEDPMVKFGRQLETYKPNFQAVLPSHIPPERFIRTIKTAITMTPTLLGCDRQALFVASMKAAQDGLLPDGREGAIVAYGNKPQWLPMVTGLIKKLRQSGDVLDVTAHVVREKDIFDYSLGDDEHITHKPFFGGDAGEIIAAYAIIKLKSGERHRTVMSKAEIDKVRASSKMPNGPMWAQWYDQAAEKTVIRRAAKRCPMSTEIDEMLVREESPTPMPDPISLESPDAFQE